jgi:hypothetical protein
MNTKKINNRKKEYMKRSDIIAGSVVKLLMGSNKLTAAAGLMSL